MSKENAIYDALGFGLVDKLVQATSFNDDQIRLLSEGLSDCGSVLDLCVGFGNLSRRLVDEGKTVYGVDISRRSLDYAKQKVGEDKKGKFYLVQGDARKLPFADYFDGVGCASNLGFSDDDIEYVISGIYRSLKEGGIFAVTGYESGSQSNLAEKEILEKLKSGELKFTDEEVERFMSLQSSGIADAVLSTPVSDSSRRTLSLLEKYGFEVKRTEQFYFGSAYFVLAQKS